MEKILRDITKILNFHDSFFEEVESLGKLGFYEADLVSGEFKASANYKKLLGLPEKHLYKIEEFRAKVHPEDVHWVCEEFNTCRKEGRHFECTYRVIVHGELRYLCGKSIFILNDQGEPVKVVGTKKDVTEEKLAEIEKQGYIKKLECAYEMASTIVHDLKAPIHNISMIAEFLKGNIAQGKEKLLEGIEKSCRHSYEIIDDVLENSLAETCGGEIIKEHYNISHLVDESVTSLYYAAQKKNIKILRSLQRDIYAFVHVRKLQRGVENLLFNAIKFSHMDSQIEVSLYEKGDIFVISIKDFGNGMNEKQKSLLFHKDNPFRQEGTNGEKSFGLGLNIVNKITRQHGGRIRVESQEAVGSTFYIELPKE